MSETIIILGANGQIGTELATVLRQKHGAENVITTDIKEPDFLDKGVVFYQQDVLDKQSVEELFKKHQPTQVYLMAAMLSATAENYPEKAWDLNRSEEHTSELQSRA